MCSITKFVLWSYFACLLGKAYGFFPQSSVLQVSDFHHVSQESYIKIVINFKISAAVSVPVAVPDRKFFFNYGFQFNYNMPFSPTSFYKPTYWPYARALVEKLDILHEQPNSTTNSHENESITYLTDNKNAHDVSVEKYQSDENRDRRDLSAGELYKSIENTLFE